MISRIGLAVSRLFQHLVPDPLVLAVGLTLVTAALAMIFGRFPEEVTGVIGRGEFLLDAWRADDGLWKFLSFGMQMCLILVTGHALASTRPVHGLIQRLSELPRSTASAAAMVGFVAALTGLINWGLGLIVGALLARDVGKALQRRGIRAHYPLICAAGYMGLLVWHGGLSGSAPLSMTTITGAAKVLPAEYIQTLSDQNAELARDPNAGIGLSETIGSTQNMLVSGGLLLGIPLLLMLLAPRQKDDMQPVEEFNLTDATTLQPERSPSLNLPDRLDRSPIVAWLLAVPLVLATARYVNKSGLEQLDLNTINATMLGLGLILHGSARAYMNAVTEGARGCAGIIIQFPLYAGIMAMMQQAGLVQMIAESFTRIGNETTIPVLSFLSAAVVNLFVPSGGGQWGIQGPIALETGLQAGLEPGKMIMSVAYGDQLTNMVQPFWALPLLAITGVRARDIVGYTTVVMVAAGAWMILGLLVF